LHTLVIASQKGGSGKTTLCGHLAVEAERAGFGPVALVDTDPQGSLSEWWNARKASSPAFVRVGSLEIDEALAKLDEDGIKLAIVDTPPAITGAISYVVACADMVIVPTRPSPHDLRAVGATVDIAEYHGKGLVFVINDATLRARITSEAAVALSQHGVVAPVMVHNRVDFAASMIDGRTVGEVTPQSKSAEEIRDLWTYISGRLGRAQGAPLQQVRPEAAPDATPSPAAPSAPALSPVAQLTPHGALLPPQPDDDVYEWSPPANGEAPAEAEQLLAVAGAPALSVPVVNKPGLPGFVERRSGIDRRQALDARPLQGPEQRVVSPFGRRSTDRSA
jgi:chromosome partitioning protein